jgi:hypothetical protein
MNDVLRKLLERNNLVEKDGEWFYPPYSTTSWILLTCENAIRFINGFSLTKDNKINDYGFSVQYKLTEYKFIDRRVKDLIKEFNQLSRELKERKVQEKLDNIRQDF